MGIDFTHPHILGRLKHNTAKAEANKRELTDTEKRELSKEENI